MEENQRLGEEKYTEGGLRRIVVIGPVYPYTGGISHYTGLLSRALAVHYEVSTVSYSMQYPKILMRREQRDYGNKTFEIKDAQFLINTANPVNWLTSAKKIRAMEPDLVILQWWHPYFAPCYQVLTSRLKGIPLCFICHNVLPHERFPMDAFLTKNTLKPGAFCIVHSRSDGEDLRNMLPDMPFVRHVLPTYNAFKLRGIDRATGRKELGIGEEERMLLFFGYVRKYKGLPYLIRAMGGLVKKDPGMKLYIVGDFGGKKEEYLEMIEKSGAGENIIVRDGYVPDAEIEPYFAAADLCVCPYLSATQSAIVQIAYGFNVPVIATRVGGLPDVVTDNATGYVVEPGDAKALARAIYRYFEEGKQEEFRRNVARESERFSWEKMVECIAEQYKTLNNK